MKPLYIKAEELYLWRSESMPNWINPFHDSYDHEYHYFSIDNITKDVHLTQEAYTVGLTYVHNDLAQIKKVSFDFNYYYGGQELVGSFKIKINPQHIVDIVITKNKLILCRCNDYACYMDRNRISQGICEHEAAALILMTDYLAKHRPGDSTDKNALDFLMQFRRSHKSTKKDLSPTVHLRPRISYFRDSLSFRLLITNDKAKKLYVVKNIMDLFDKIEYGGTYPLGKYHTIDFTTEGFAEDSTAFGQTIKDWLQNKKERNRDRYYYSDDDMKEEIRLYGDRLDRFFDLFDNQAVESGYFKGDKIELKICNPQVVLHIKQLKSETGQFEGVTVTSKLPVLFRGNHYQYCISDDCLYRMEKEYARKLMPLLSFQSNDKDKIQFQIGRKNLAEFYYTVLPELKKIAVVKETGSAEIEQYLPPEVAFKFYLDVDNGKPECRIGTWYGDIGVAIFDLLEGSGLKQDFRDAHREQEVLDFVMQYFPEFRRNEERFLGSDDEDVMYEIMETAVPKLAELGEIVCTDRFQNIQVRRHLKISVGVSVENDLLNLQILTDDLTSAELLDILRSYKQNKKYHRLKSGEFVDLDESIEELSNMYDALHISPKEFVKGNIQLPAYRTFYLDKMLEKNQEIVAKRDSRFKQIIRNMKTVRESDFDVPETLSKTMRSYQQFGHKWLRTVGNCGFGGILADDMGLGKTLQMISVLLAEKQEGNTDTALIVCPASLVFNWAAELDKFAPELKYLIIVGTHKERPKLIKQYQDYDVVITSYDLIKRDITHYEDCSFGYQVLDEAQYIKNHTTAAAKSVKLINAKHRFALTGTPIENRLSELWSIFDYLMPGLLYGYETFKSEFETPIVKHNDESATKKLRRMTSVFILRRLKTDVLRDLPDKLEENYVVRFDEKQRHIYDAKILELQQLLQGVSGAEFQNIKLKIFSYLTQIRQICCDPGLLLSDYDGGSVKRDACMEIVQRAMEGEHRVLIFSQFTTMLEKLEQDLTSAGIAYYKIIGETPKKKRMELVERFNSDDTPVFLISLKAGGTGLNLTGADIVVHYDPWWNVAAQNQATDRAHRIGQTRAVTVYRLIAKDTIEEKIQKMQEKKQRLADSVLTGDFVNLSTMSKDELLSILT